MSNARDRRFSHVLQWVLVITAISISIGVVLATIRDALAGPVRPTPLTVEQDNPELERARRYNRRLEKILHRQISRAERHEATIRRERQATRKALGTSPIGQHRLEAAFLCIHEHEGSWRDSGWPYWGGLQMDIDFMRAYGRDYLRYFGTADRWPMSVQIAVAIRAYISRGFSPWPNTRKACGL